MKSLLVALTCVAMVTLTGCGASVPVQNEANAAEAADTLIKLESADSLVLKKDAFSIGDHWTVKVDGKEIAKIEGLDIPTLGDTYSVLSPSGGFMGGEDEDIFNMAKTANFYDEDKNVTGKLTKEILSFGAKYNLADTNGDRVARLEQKFGMTFKGQIKDSKDRIAWELSRTMFSMGAEITLTRKASDSTAGVMEAILMSVVASEIYDAENEK